MARHQTSRTSQRRRGSRAVAVQQAQRRQRLIILLGGGVAVAVIAVVLLIVLNQGSAGDVEAAPPLDAGIPTAGRTMGDPNAQVTVVEWGDYQ